MKKWFRKKWRWLEKHMTPCIVVFAIAIVILFTIVDIVLQINGVALSDTLIEWVYKFFGLELLALSGIKVSKHIGSAFGKMEAAIDGTEAYDEEPVG